MTREDQLQLSIANYLRLRYPAAFWTHPPNGGSRHKLEAVKFKRIGVRAGLPDILIFERRGTATGLFLELKVGKNKATELQLMAMSELVRNGWKGGIVYDFDSAKEMIDEYLND